MRIGPNAFGVQFHPEVTEAMMRRWSTAAGHRLALPGAQARETMRAACAQYDAGIAAWLDGFLDIWLQSGVTYKNRGKEAVGAMAGGR